MCALMLIIASGFPPAPKAAIEVCYDESPESRSVLKQWKYRCKLPIRMEHKATVRFVHWWEVEPLAGYPAWRVGRGEHWTPFPRAACCPCGCAVIYLDWVADDWRYPLTSAYREYLQSLHEFERGIFGPWGGYYDSDNGEFMRPIAPYRRRNPFEEMLR